MVVHGMGRRSGSCVALAAIGFAVAAASGAAFAQDTLTVLKRNTLIRADALYEQPINPSDTLPARPPRFVADSFRLDQVSVITGIDTGVSPDFADCVSGVEIRFYGFNPVEQDVGFVNYSQVIPAEDIFITPMTESRAIMSLDLPEGFLADAGRAYLLRIKPLDPTSDTLFCNCSDTGDGVSFSMDHRRAILDRFPSDLGFTVRGFRVPVREAPVGGVGAALAGMIGVGGIGSLAIARRRRTL